MRKTYLYIYIKEEREERKRKMKRDDDMISWRTKMISYPGKNKERKRKMEM
jgi:protein subunit release factor B